MGYYSKEDYVLLRDEPGTTDGSLERWSPVHETWRPYGLFKRHLAQNVLRPISAEEAEALKTEGGGPSQPASALIPKG